MLLRFILENQNTLCYNTILHGTKIGHWGDIVMWQATPFLFRKFMNSFQLLLIKEPPKTM